MELTKDDWEKTVRQAQEIHKDMLMSAAVAACTVKLAREMIKSFPDDSKNKS